MFESLRFYCTKKELSACISADVVLTSTLLYCAHMFEDTFYYVVAHSFCSFTRLCAHNKPSIPVTQECLDATVLTVIGSGKRFYLPHDKPAVFELQLQLPPYTTCTQCVLQWKYHAGIIRTRSLISFA